MSREVHVRFREGVGGRLPRATRLLLGFSGPREEAEGIKEKLRAFLHDNLKMELSEGKTLITHARTEAARFLGYEIITLYADDNDHRGQRCINGVLGLKVPVDFIKEKCSQYMQRGKPTQLAARMQDTGFSIVTQYQAEFRGFVQYYLLAFNVHRLWRLRWVMEVSLVKTLADKFRTTASRSYQKYRRTIPTPNGTPKVLVVTVDRSETKKPLVAVFGGLELRWQKQATLEDQPTMMYSSLRSEVVQRLLAQKCELCETTEGPFQVHHVRKLADLDRPGQGKKPPWVKKMASRRRKTLVVCQRCHEDIHLERPRQRTVRR
jgi:AI2M/AI1M-like HNH endonuclease/type II intron maturase